MKIGAIDLMKHQGMANLIAQSRMRFGYYWKPGTGKTLASLSIQSTRPMRTLVLAQKSIIWSAWVEQAAAAGMKLVVAWHYNKKKRLELIRQPGDHIIVTNYEQFRTHVDDFMATGVKRLICDEASKLKNREAAVTKAAITMSDRVQEVYILTGTPTPNSYIDLWSQLRIISINASGSSFWKWAYHWFIPDMKYVRNRQVITGWRMKPGVEKQFFEYLRGWTWALRKEDCVDLPPKTEDIRWLNLSEDEQAAYNSVIDELKIEVPPGSDITGPFRVRAEAATMKLRQIVGGAVKTSDGREVLLGSTKLTAVCEWLDEVGDDEPVIIWGEFTSEINRIAAALRHRNESVEIIDGRTGNRLKEIIDGFTAGKIKRLVCHPKAAGHGTDGLQKVCQYAAYYSLSYNADEHEQSQDRIHRKGQNGNCTYVYFLGVDTIDQNLLSVVKRKASAQDVLMAELNRR